MCCGFDAGTFNLVCCTRDKDGKFDYKREVNAFLEIKLEDRAFLNVMKEKDVPIIEREKVAYIVGETAVQMAYAMSNLELRRPMREGCVNNKEKDAYEILNIMIHSLIENISYDKEPLYFSVPANAINEETDADYHTQILQSIFKAYESDEGYKVIARPINEGLALIYAELADKNYTGIGISFGSGLVNLCYSIFGVPVFQFAIANSGDWIDKMSAKATGETSTFINREKLKISLSDSPKTLVERAIQTQYRIMVQKTIQQIKKGIEDSGKKARHDAPLDIVIAGGTSMPPGFDGLFREILDTEKLPIQVNSVIRPEDPLYSVARGCLIAAEHYTKD